MADFNAIQQKWQKKWADSGIFKVTEDPDKPKYYVLEMYPYPSGKLHMGHVRNYSIGDAFARYKRMRGFNVLYPMGYDSFGLPAENAAIKNKADPRKWTDNNVQEMKAQQMSMGLSYDWDRMVYSHDPNYYKWNQWVFLKLFEKGLVYRKPGIVNWCPKCDTVLANEQVHDGKCWRHSDTEVEQKELEQWYFKITEYAEELLNDIEKLENWPERVRIMQKNWIGKSHGTMIEFDIVDEDGKKIDKIQTFTTRPDTAFGITYLVLAIEHPKVLEWTKGTDKEKEVKEFINNVKKQSIIERTAEGKEKNGVFLGKYFINPVNGEKCPLWVADYALYEYGTGAVMAVPTHDQRDFEFAKKYKLPMRIVINPHDFDLDVEKMNRAFVDEGVMVNSGEFDGMNNRDAIEDMSKWMEKQGFGKRTVNYKLRDWLVSRQRYWGTPIPVIYCEKCGVVGAKLEELPVELPEDVDFSKGGNPMETSDGFINCKCPKCGGKGKRETDTMDTFVDSSWYFLRYCSPRESSLPFSKDSVKYWMPVDQYIGGIEHACMHLIYARFFTKATRDLGLHNIDEPFTRLLCQGMVIKDGAKMSKSLGNTVDPGLIIDKYSADTARLFILFAALPEKELDWSDSGVEGAFRYLNRAFRLVEEMPEFVKREENNKDKHIIAKMHKTIKVVTEHIDRFELSLGIGKLMEFTNAIYKYTDAKDVNETVYREAVSNLALLVSPFVPHVAEEMWEKLSNKDMISLQKWPEYDEGKIDEDAEASEEMIHQTLSDIMKVKELAKVDVLKKVTLFVSSAWKYDFVKVLKEQMDKTRNPGEIIKAIMATDLKEYGQEITKIVKNSQLLPEVVTDQATELNALAEGQEFMKEELKCDVDIVKEEDSSEAKAKQAMPGKLAVLVE
ncbi:leucine--tRNA ligase [Nanoarchaeota archaeon]